MQNNGFQDTEHKETKDNDSFDRDGNKQRESYEMQNNCKYKPMVPESPFFFVNYMTLAQQIYRCGIRCPFTTIRLPCQPNEMTEIEK